MNQVLAAPTTASAPLAIAAIALATPEVGGSTRNLVLCASSIFVPVFFAARILIFDLSASLLVV